MHPHQSSEAHCDSYIIRLPRCVVITASATLAPSLAVIAFLLGFKTGVGIFVAAIALVFALILGWTSGALGWVFRNAVKILGSLAALAGVGTGVALAYLVLHDATRERVLVEPLKIVGSASATLTGEIAAQHIVDEVRDIIYGHHKARGINERVLAPDVTPKDIAIPTPGGYVAYRVVSDLIRGALCHWEVGNSCRWELKITGEIVDIGLCREIRVRRESDNTLTVKALPLEPDPTRELFQIAARAIAEEYRPALFPRRERTNAKKAHDDCLIGDSALAEMDRRNF
jgi:hypothetical protein